MVKRIDLSCVLLYNENMFILVLLLLLSLCSGSSSWSSISPVRLKEHIPNVEYSVIEIESSYKKYDEGWFLDIEDIDLSVGMEEVYPKNRTIPVPDETAGVYRSNGGLFIVGHYQGVFSRLNEIPKSILISFNGNGQRYISDFSEELLVEEIKMNDLLNYNGVVIMTCSGEWTGSSWSKRLILMYKRG